MFQLSERGYGVDKSSLSKNELAKLYDELTVTPVISNSIASITPPTITLYMESSKKIYLPKYYGLQKFGAPDTYKYHDIQEVDVKFHGLLRKEQHDPVTAFLNAAKNPVQAGGIINLACASGKTVMALYILSQLKMKSLIVVHKDFLLDQWRERIETFLPTARVGLIKAKIIDVEDKDIVLASLQSLAMKDYEPTCFKGFGFLIIDEVHRTGTEVFSQALKKLNMRVTLGLSATVTRKDGMSKVFKWYIGDIVYKGKRKKQDSVNVVMHQYWANDTAYNKEVSIGYNKLNFSRMISNICAYKPRTDMICGMIINLLHDEKSLKRRKVLVLSERKNHLASIKDTLHELDDSVTSGFYYGGMSPSQLEDSTKKDVLLGTFAMASEGFDLKELDTLVLATPKACVEQAVGRILRATESERANNPLIIDIVDMFSIYERQAAKRKVLYAKCGFNVISNDMNETSNDTNGLFIDE